MPKRILALLLLLITIGCDRVTKHVATARLAGMPAQSYLAGTVRLEYAENRGAFLSVGAHLSEWSRFVVLQCGVAAILAFLAFVALKQRWSGLALAGASFTIAGGLSNLADRISRGSVVDFMTMGIGPWWTGIFNVADLAIVLGGTLIVIGRSREPKLTPTDGYSPNHPAG
jgi:signal peptidase II